MTAKYPRTTIRLMKREDLAFADSLRALTGWNQTRADWERLLGHDPEGCFVAEYDAQPAGTATTTIYSQALAWIGMVLVHPDRRGVGIGTALLEHCIDHLKGRQIGCIKLDATPQGRKVYIKLGFQDEWPLRRWERSNAAGCVEPFPSDARCSELERIGRVESLDVSAFGVSRQWLLDDFHRRGAKVICSSKEGSVTGYAMLRRGSIASYLGPAVAVDNTTGAALVHELMRRADSGAVYWDIPDSNRAATALARAIGFRHQRPLMRMFLGLGQAVGDATLQWGIADPALG